MRVAEPGRVAGEGGEVRKAPGVDAAVRPEQGVPGELVEDEQDDVRAPRPLRLGVTAANRAGGQRQNQHQDSRHDGTHGAHSREKSSACC